MTPEQNAQVKEIFLGAVERSPAERAAFVTQRCAGDETLLHEVEKLLAHYDSVTITPAAVDATVPAIGARADGSPGGSGHAAQPAAVSPSEDNDRPRFAPGTIVAGRYRIVARLGKGGMGVVYRADDLTLRQTVALKFLAPAMAANPAWLARFRSEVRLARRVTHPNVCRVYDIGEADGTWFLSMEYVDGEDLATLSRRIGRLSIDKALSMGREICIGLAVAHDVGILHRDLKPANIMIDGRGRIRITDFGLAAATGTVGGGDIRAGTLAYMAPEQIAGHEVTMKSDLYSLGLVLYELFGGQAAFRADSTAGCTELLKRDNPAPLSEVAPDIPAEVDRIIRQCLAKDPQDRPRSALAIAGALAGTTALEAAVAANLTPSPDTIAAATPRVAVAKQPAWLVAGAGRLLGALVLARSHAAYPWDATDTKPPAVLLESARRVVRDVGCAVDSVDFAFGFCTPDGIQKLLNGYLSRRSVGRQLRLGDQHQLVFWYRQRGDWLAPVLGDNLIFGSARVTPLDPPPDIARDLYLAMTDAGRLLLFTAAPAIAPERTAQKASSGDSNSLQPLLHAAQLNSSDLEPSEPTLQPLFPVDERRAWRVDNLHGGAMPVRVEACLRSGRPVFVVIEDVPSSEDPVGSINGGPSRESTSALWLQLMFFMVAMIALPLAWLNYRNGRIDRMGSMRLATVVFVLQFVVWALRATHTPALNLELSTLCMACLQSLGVAALVAILYTALEPLARRYWPEMLIAWARLLTGRWRDAVVGHHVLVGVCFGCALALLFATERAVVLALGWQAREPPITENAAQVLLGGRVAASAILAALRDALARALLFLLLLALLRAVVQRPLRAAMLAALLLSAAVIPRGAHPATAWLALGVCGAGLGVWIMVRFGLIALTVAFFVSLVLNHFPFTWSARAWSLDLSLASLAVVAAVALTGFWGTRATSRTEPTLTGRSSFPAAF